MKGRTGNSEVESGGGSKIRQKIETASGLLDDGLAIAAEKLLVAELGKSTSDEEKAILKTLLAFSFEIQGRYQDSLEVLKPFQGSSTLEALSPETRVALLTQLAICYSNLTDFPIAVAILNRCKREAEQERLEGLLGNIFVSFSRVYRKLSEIAIARDFAQKALRYFRVQGDWRGIAEAYREIGGSFHLEGNSRKGIEYFNLAIKMVGDRSAPFQLGKVYSELAGAYWFLRRPQDGIACLEKSIEFFAQTEHKVQSVAAYNNLGINLILLGEWKRAEEAINRALEIANEVDHAHRSGVLDSLGELQMLRGELGAAEKLFEEAIDVAEERKRDFYRVQAMRNLSRCYVLQNRLDEARFKAEETLAICNLIKGRQVANMTLLVLAECDILDGRTGNALKHIEAIEATDPSSELFVLGMIQRLRGLIKFELDDYESGVYHLKRAITIFETSEDVYQIATAHFELGKKTATKEPKKAAANLKIALEIFRRLGVDESVAKVEAEIALLSEKGAGQLVSSSNYAQLLMMRLTEATASRELLFRELVAVLSQESEARKIILAESNDERRFQPFITNGFSIDESASLTDALSDALAAGDLDNFAENKNLAAFVLSSPNSPAAVLMMFPREGAQLIDGSAIDPLLKVVTLGMDLCALRREEHLIHTEEDFTAVHSPPLIPGFIHSSPAMSAVVDEILKIRSSDVTVLITGDSGTGKEMVARAIHATSNRKDRVFIPFNCTAVPKELVEGHLFGYKKGAFTGAVSDSPGMIRAADGGTLFLDEIGDLPIDVQPKLLRFLQEGEIQALGEGKPSKVDVRIIAATNMPLEQKVADESFREDLYYRLNVIRLRVPPLRERRSEIPLMINYYLKQYSERFGKRDLTVTPQTVDLLMVCEWDGNVRQLCNEIQRLVARAEDGEIITPDHLSPDLQRGEGLRGTLSGEIRTEPITEVIDFGGFNFKTKGARLEDAVTELEKQMITDSLRRHNWNITRVSKELGLTRRGLYLKLARYGIEKAVWEK